ncbi:hypothetical protein BVRB_7g161260 [Beta vulgaris subsp. vulgaris]|nr:hypothetical protein BVRB_7g161260 [Beta vulgaris subsp. vulgaris]
MVMWTMCCYHCLLCHGMSKTSRMRDGLKSHTMLGDAAI